MNEREYADGRLRTPADRALQLRQAGHDFVGILTTVANIDPWGLAEVLGHGPEFLRGEEFREGVRVWAEINRGCIDE